MYSYLMKKVVLVLVAVLIIAIFVFWQEFRFALPHAEVTITLPFAPKNDDVQFVNPMGEKVEHPDAPHGHPGIDFGWNHPVELVAPMSGKVTNIKVHPPGGFGELTTIYDVEITNGVYATRFQEITYREGLAVGDRVEKGDVVGYAGSYSPPGAPGTFYSVHWEFDYDSFVYDRLCPMTYFDEEALSRVNTIWGRAGETYNGTYTKLCSADYDGRNGYGARPHVDEVIKNTPRETARTAAAPQGAGAPFKVQPPTPTSAPPKAVPHPEAAPNPKTASNPVAPATAPASSDEPPLLLKSIGVNLDYYNPNTERAGDFAFTKQKLSFNRLLTGFGFVIPGNMAEGGKDKLSPQPTFIVPLGTKVRSLVDGVVAATPTVWSGDYSIQVSANGKVEKWLYETEHVKNPLVHVGDRVTAGQVIAEVSDYDRGLPSGFGIVEIGILKGGPVPEHICPFAYLDPSVKKDIHDKLAALFDSWEAYLGNNTLYNQEPTPGCSTLAPIEG